MIGVGATLNERFTLEKELGQGGMGTVYRATDQVLGRNVAIKLLKDAGTENDARQIRLEAQILARLVHDRIVRLYDFGEEAGTCFLVMEEVDGPSFASRLQDLQMSDRLRICGQVAEALDYAHVQGVIHRDVKPGNVLLTPSDAAKLSDFGLSLVTGERRDQSVTIRGTPRYMSPEQAQGKPLDHRTDLYSVGVMVYESATGDAPFVGNMMTVLSKHISATPTAPRFANPEVSSTLENLILSLMEKKPTRRPASGRVVALELFEEAERARRLERINPGLRRSDPRNGVDCPLSRTMTVGESKAAPAPANGSGQVYSGPVMSATEPPPEVPNEPSRTGPRTPLESFSHPAASEMLSYMLATPIIISPEERYLCGHYLAYLLGGSRRRGIFFRRALDQRNADRARLLLAMTWLSCVGPTHEAIERASSLLEDRPDVRAALSPMVVMKYLASRDTPPKRQRFRLIRQRLLESSAYARKKMVNARGILNPGLMPRNLDDLALIAPPLETLDAYRVSLWNRLAEVWRQDDEFRRAVCRYATRSDRLDTASTDLWPEVVYPLIERAHWQRRFRPRLEAIWDYVVGKILHVPVPGVRLDRMMVIAIPREVAEQLDLDLLEFVDEPWLEADDASSSGSQETVKARPFWVGGTIPREEPTGDPDAPLVIRPPVSLAPADPFLFTQKTLRELWEGAISAQNNSGAARSLRRTIPVGRYELAVVPTAGSRSAIRSAVRAVLQGMEQGKQIEIFTPPAQANDAASRTVIAVWTYEDASMAVVHLDFQYKERYVLWHAPDAHHFDFTHVEGLKGRLSTLNLEVPEQLDRVFLAR